MKNLITYQLFEMTAEPYMWKWDRIPATANRVATFSSPDDKFVVEFIPSGYDNTYKVTFESDKYGVNASGLGNTGNAMRVFATVLDVVIAFLDDNAEYEVEFIGAKGDSDSETGPSKRDRIYKNMMADLPDEYEWELASDGKTIRIKKALVMQESLTQAGLGSIVLVTGEKLDDGTHRLFAVPIQKVLAYERMKADNTKGQTASMVLLGDDYYRLKIEDGKLKTAKVGFSSKVNMLKALGMTEKNLSGERLKIVLNSKTGKTPLHWESLKYNYIGKMINELGPKIMDLPNIRWSN